MTLAADKEFNLHAFARDLINWSDDARIDWTFDYFGKHHQPMGAEAETQSTELPRSNRNEPLSANP